MEDHQKPAYGTPEWMAYIRQKAADARAAKKAAQAAPAPEPAPQPAPEPQPPSKPAPAPEAPSDEDEVAPLPPPPVKRARQPRAPVEPDEPDYRQLYYKAKWERMMAPPAPPPPPPKQPSPRKEAYEVARANIRSHVNRQVMSSLYESMFPGDRNPYG
jgi:hypothetical protein